MKNKKENIIFALEASLLISLITLVLTYLITYYWLRDGFDLIEISFLSITSSVFFFFSFMIVCIWQINKFTKFSKKNSKSLFNKFLLLFVILVISLLIYSLIDTFIYYFVDNSVPYEFSLGLENMSKRSGTKLEGIEDFKNLSFSLQNGVTNFLALLISSFICIPFIKKDGEIFKTSTSDYR